MLIFELGYSQTAFHIQMVTPSDSACTFLTVNFDMHILNSEFDNRQMVRNFIYTLLQMLGMHVPEGYGTYIVCVCLSMVANTIKCLYNILKMTIHVCCVEGFQLTDLCQKPSFWRCSPCNSFT